MKIETDTVEVLSGVRHGRTLGSPVSLLVRNQDHANWSDVMSPDPQPDAARERRRLRYPRPGHADLAGALKYGTDDLRNVLERASARETTARVAAGALARALLRAAGVEVRSHVAAHRRRRPARRDASAWEALDRIEDSPVRCADAAAAGAMIAEIDRAKKDGDSVGGVVEVIARGAPPGPRLLRPVGPQARRADRPGAHVDPRGQGGGDRRRASPAGRRAGSAFHDEILCDDARGLERPTNRAGGLEGGVTNGEELRAQAVVKPIPTLLIAAALDRPHDEGAAEGLGRAQRHLRGAGGRCRGRGHARLVLADALLEKFGRRLPRASSSRHLEATRAQQRARSPARR